MAQNVNWFPVQDFYMGTDGELHEAWRDDISATGKVVHWFLTSEANKRLPFYHSDIQIAAAIGAGERTVREQRMRLRKLGLIEWEQGGRPNGRGLANRFTLVKGAQVGDGNGYAPMHRFAFEAILKRVREKQLTHADLVTYVSLNYAHQRLGNRERFFVTKQYLHDLTGLDDAPKSVARLYETFTFTPRPDGKANHLFDYEDLGRRIVIANVVGFADPGEDEKNRKNASAWDADVQQRATDLRRKHMSAEDFPKIAQQIAGKHKLRFYVDDDAQEKGLVTFATSVGIPKASKALDIFLDHAKPGTKGRLCYHFLNQVRERPEYYGLPSSRVKGLWLGA